VENPDLALAFESSPRTIEVLERLFEVGETELASRSDADSMENLEKLMLCAPKISHNLAGIWVHSIVGRASEGRSYRGSIAE
jgi:hypothetical protein